MLISLSQAVEPIDVVHDPVASATPHLPLPSQLKVALIAPTQGGKARLS